MKDLAILVVNRNRPDLTDSLVEQLDPMGDGISKDIFVIELGSDEKGKSRYASFEIDEQEFAGKANGHIKGLEWLLETNGRYRHYGFLMNDLVFQASPDPLARLVHHLDSEPRMGLISPTETSPYHRKSLAKEGSLWRKVSSPDYLALFMKGECLHEVGFFKPDFPYSWGAIFELSYRMHTNNWFLAYCDDVVMTHLGGTTYGATKGTISRDDYQEKAKAFCANYFRENFGPKWDKRFSNALPDGAEDYYREHRRQWEGRSEPPLMRRILRRLGVAK
ncbi:MAG: hypothetical protein AAF589_04845 [Planctomycetota bacterium]